MACLHKISKKICPVVSQLQQVDTGGSIITCTHYTECLQSFRTRFTKNWYLNKAILLLLSLQHTSLTLYTYWHGHNDSESLRRS